MRQLELGVTKKVYVLLMESADHITPKTGVVAGDVTCYYCKQGGSATVYDVTGKWVEISALNMPGVYSIELTAGVLDTMGSFVISIQVVDCDVYTEKFQVLDLAVEAEEEPRRKSRERVYER